MLHKLPSSHNDGQRMVMYSSGKNMDHQLSLSHDNGQSMVIYPSSMKHALSVGIVSWQRSEHGYSSLRHETCFVSCHRFMQRSEHVYSSLRYEKGSVSCHRPISTVRACLFIPKVWKRLCQLSSSHINGQSMVMYSSGMKHAPAVVIVSWQTLWAYICQV